MPDYGDVRALVLGASGFSGRRVARALSAAGADLSLAVRTARHGMVGEFPGAREVELDLLDTAALRDLVEETAPDIVFNLAGYGINPAERDPALAEHINAAFLATLVEAVAALQQSRWPGQRIVHTGSALEYGVCSGDLAETTEPQPTTLYGRTKLAGTRLLQKSSAAVGLSSVTARLFTVYGPGERSGRLLPALMELAREGGSLDLTAGIQQRDFTYVDDVAEGLLRLGTVQTTPGEVVNLATGRLHTVREFVETAAGVLGIPAGDLHFGALPMRQEEMAHLPVATGKLQNLLEWLPTTSIRQGVERTRQAMQC